MKNLKKLNSIFLKPKIDIKNSISTINNNAQSFKNPKKEQSVKTKDKPRRQKFLVNYFK